MKQRKFQQTVSSLQLSFSYLYLLLDTQFQKPENLCLSFTKEDLHVFANPYKCYISEISEMWKFKTVSYHLQLHSSSKLFREESALPNSLEKKQKLLTQQGNFTQKQSKYLTFFKGKLSNLHCCLYVTVSILPSKIQSINLLCKSKDSREDKTKKKFVRQKVISEIVYS